MYHIKNEKGREGMLKEKESCSLEQTGKELLHNEEIEEIFAYYGKQRDKGSQEMVIALLRRASRSRRVYHFETKTARFGDYRDYGQIPGLFN